ncbi:hypothetical protein HPP92_014621 [Vanilla planifolia]|uniref:Uncharacterized protein n=1 Tax=Vanilla planifolia TaxID=51239 RepID=A0A835QKC4_VANPL|nr:hypothetical protein HPP92_015043 [Vanilla planifolia]KAG0474935.1 hypothetical protein HPP92_014621 [Vanilla planifolia]
MPVFRRERAVGSAARLWISPHRSKALTGFQAHLTNRIPSLVRRRPQGPSPHVKEPHPTRKVSYRKAPCAINLLSSMDQSK